MLIPEIDRLLEADENNISEMRRQFFDFDHDLPEMLNQAAVIYHTYNRAFSQGLDAHFLPLFTSMATIGTSTVSGFKAKLEGPVPAGQEEIFKSCRRAFDEFYARQNRAMLLVRMGVLYGMAVADFLRMRLTAPMAYLRLQCESLAMMKLMRDDPVVARKWQEIITENQGMTFFRKHQDAVKGILGLYGLSFAYNYASSTALHSRFAGIVFGLRVSSTIEGNWSSQELKILAQEFDPDNPYPFLLMVLHALRVQERIFSSLPDCTPEVRDPLLLETRIPQFRAAVDGLFDRFTHRHPDLIRRYEQAAERAASGA